MADVQKKAVGLPVIPEDAIGYYTPYLQLLIRLSLPVVVIIYGIFQDWNLLIFSVPTALILCAVYFLWHVLIHYLTKKYGLRRELLIAAYAADVAGGHLAWLCDPQDPAPLFLNILFGAFGNGLQHGLYTYKYLCFFNLIATVIVYSVRCSIFGFSVYGFIMVFLGYCLLGYAYRMIQKNDHYKNQIKLKNTLLVEEVDERRKVEAALLENESELKEYRDKLEKMVVERTYELENTNRLLKEEIETRIVIETQNRESQKNEKLYQEQLFQAAKMTSLGTLVAGVAHEINNPVSAIMLNAPLLKRISDSAAGILDERYGENEDFRIGSMSYSELRTKVPLLIGNISEGAERIKNIIDDLKDYSRETNLEMVDAIDLNIVAEKAVGLVSNLIRKSTYHFKFENEDTVPLFIGNNGKIEQVVINLLINACQSVSNMEASIRLMTFHDKSKRTVGFRVVDQGAGMASEVLSMIKDPFFTTKRDSGGTGLGLSISDRIVREHNGSLDFKSIPGGGTTVTVAFPVSEKKQGGESG